MKPTQVPKIDRRVSKLRRQFRLADKMKKVKKTMYKPETKKTDSKTASQTLRDMAHSLLSELEEKQAFVPGAEIGQMDPAMMGGMPPVDPATGMPMDPSMMGGAPPMDPAMMGAPPMDPAMMGAPPAEPAPAAPAAPPAEPAPAEAPAEGSVVSIEEFQQLQDQVESLENTIMELLDMVEKSKSLAPPEEEEGAAPASVQQDMAQPMGGPMAPGANAALGELRLNNLGNPDALGGLINRLQG